MITSCIFIKIERGVMRYKPGNRHDIKVLSEVHVYIVPDSNITTGNYLLLPGNIQKIVLIKKNNGKSIGSFLLGIGILAAFFVGVSIAAISDWSFGSFL